MRLFKNAILIGTVATAAFAISASPTSATPLSSALGNLQTSAAAQSLVVQVQGRRRGGGGGRRGGRRGRNIGAGVAAGVAIGVLGAIAADAARRHDDAIEDCADRHPSYDPDTQTWWDRRGRPHRCP